MNSVDLSIVAPFYNEEETLVPFFVEVKRVLENLPVTWEIICINDGSDDRTLDGLLIQASSDSRIKIIDFSRNFGKEAALTAGLDQAQGRAVIPIDVDLQDPPQLIETMVKKWKEGYDIVYATRTIRTSDTFLKRTTAAFFYYLYNRMTSIHIPPNAGDFRLMDRCVVEALKRMPERNRFMKGLFCWPGYKQAEITYKRQPRLKGKTKFNYWRLWNFALDGVTSFTTIPLRIWTYLGSVVAIFAFLYAAFLVTRTLIYGIDVPGYASLMVVMLFLGGVQLISVGIIGEYIGRTYNEVKQRPIYLIKQAYNFDDVDKEKIYWKQNKFSVDNRRNHEN